jgi:two-component system response regulator (stage 0 sporulation protein F)
MLKVLLVEDDADQRNLYRDSFIDAGFEVVTACNGNEALKCFKASRPDAVVLDIQMPGMDGIEALGKIITRDKKTVGLFYSAYPAFKSNFMTWAADAFVVKTGDPTEIVNEVRKLLAEHGVTAV